LTAGRRGHDDLAIRGSLTALVLVVTGAMLAAVPGSAARSRCDVSTPAGDVVDCFSGAYHGTGFLPMEETITFKPISAAQLHTDVLWRQWLADAARSGEPKPCRNGNAIAYKGSFSFYNGGSFIACSRATPNLLSGFFRVRRTYSVDNEGAKVTLTHGVFSASADWDKVLELVFSDAVHQHFAQPEVVLGKFKN
jgi:hypothetical protein